MALVAGPLALLLGQAALQAFGRRLRLVGFGLTAGVTMAPYMVEPAQVVEWN